MKGGKRNVGCIRYTLLLCFHDTRNITPWTGTGLSYFVTYFDTVTYTAVTLLCWYSWYRPRKMVSECVWCESSEDISAGVCVCTGYFSLSYVGFGSFWKRDSRSVEYYVDLNV